MKVLIIADTHLLGSRNGHWLDKLRREWQMHRSFQTAMTLHKPELVFVLGRSFLQFRLNLLNTIYFRGFDR